MAIIIRDVSDDEIRQSCEIEGRAYQGSDLNTLFNFGTPSPKEKEKRIQAIVDMRIEDSKIIYKQAFDEEAGTMIAFAKWIVLATPEAAAQFYRPVPNLGTGKNAEMGTFFFSSLAERQKHHMGGKPYICVFSFPRFALPSTYSHLMQFSIFYTPTPTFSAAEPDACS